MNTKFKEIKTKEINKGFIAQLTMCFRLAGIDDTMGGNNSVWLESISVSNSFYSCD